MATHSCISCLENPMDRGTWGATVHGVTKSQPRLSISAAPQKVTELPYDLAIPHLGYTSKELKAGTQRDTPMP